MRKKYWQTVDFESCFSCGDDVEAFTDAPEGLFSDGDEVRCVACHYPGRITIDEEAAYVSWNV